LPNQTISEIINIINFLNRHQAIIGPSIFYALPDMPLNNFIDISNIKWTQMRMTAVGYETQYLDRLTQLTLLRFIRFINLSKMYCVLDKFDYKFENLKIETFTKFNDEQLFYILRDLLKKFNKIYGINKIVKNKNKFIYEFYEHLQNFELPYGAVDW